MVSSWRISYLHSKVTPDWAQNNHHPSSTMQKGTRARTIPTSLSRTTSYEALIHHRRRGRHTTIIPKEINTPSILDPLWPWNSRQRRPLCCCIASSPSVRRFPARRYYPLPASRWISDSTGLFADNINTLLHSSLTDISFSPDHPVTISTFVDATGSYRAVPHVLVDGGACVPVMFPQLADTFTKQFTLAGAIWALLNATQEKLREILYLPKNVRAVLNPGGITLKDVLGVTGTLNVPEKSQEITHWKGPAVPNLQVDVDGQSGVGTQRLGEPFG